jgi:membrane protease YdiL (CAAX protease family)
MLLITWIAGITINGVAGPLVEEMYFRGHLLPHLERLGRWSPAVNTTLFALYHFASPWQFFARALGLMPLFYFVWRRSNIYVGIAVHCALNTMGALVVLPRLLTLV